MTTYERIYTAISGWPTGVLVISAILIYLFLAMLSRSVLLYDRFGFGWFAGDTSPDRQWARSNEAHGYRFSDNDAEFTVFLGLLWPLTWAIIFVVCVCWAGLRLGRGKPKTPSTNLPTATVVERDRDAS